MTSNSDNASITTFNSVDLSPPVLRRERPEDYTIPLVRQDTVVLPPPVLRRERPEDYLFVSPDRIHNIQMPETPVANRTSDIDLSQIRPRRLSFN